MGIEDAINDLTETAYAAALDDTLWPEWSWGVTRLIGGKSCLLCVLGDNGMLRHHTIIHPDPAVAERYVGEEMYRTDPQVPFVSALKRSCVYTDVDHLNLDDPATLKYLEWQRSVPRIRHYATATARLAGGDFAGLSVHWDATEGPASPEAVRRLERLLPDLGRAMALGFTHAEKLSLAYWDGLLAQQREPSALIDPEGRIIRMTDAFEAMIVSGDGVSSRHGRLACPIDSADEHLRTVIDGASNGTPRRACTCLIARKSGRPAYVATAYPLTEQAHQIFERAAVLLTIVDPLAVPFSTSRSGWIEAFGFTAREAELAALLMQRHSIETAAATLAISTPTARIHLRNLFAKTRTHRQSELVLLLSRLC
jgi:DNA-binding CsgD family transcriptional regulator